MFSVSEKREIAKAVEELLLKLDHPEMPKERPEFHLYVEGKESWSWADIEPNWIYDSDNKPNINPWNEIVREQMKEETEG